MELAVTLSLHINPETWAAEYGMDEKDVPADALDYMQDFVTDAMQTRLAQVSNGTTLGNVKIRRA